MDPQICYRAWVLVSIESEEEQELFWNGKQFVPELGKAKLFSSSAGNADLCKTFGTIQTDLSGIIAGREKTDEKCSVRRKQDGN